MQNTVAHSDAKVEPTKQTEAECLQTGVPERRLNQASGADLGYHALSADVNAASWASRESSVRDRPETAQSQHRQLPSLGSSSLGKDAATHQEASSPSSSIVAPVYTNVAKPRFRRTESYRFGNVTFIPGNTRRWKQRKKRIGHIWATVWEEVQGSEDPLFRRNVALIAKSNASGATRRLVRSRRSVTSTRYSAATHTDGVSYVKQPQKAFSSIGSDAW